MAPLKILSEYYQFSVVTPERGVAHTHPQSYL